MAEHDPEPRFVTVTATIPPDWKAEIERIAAAEDLNFSQVIRRFLRPHVEKAKPPEAAKPTNGKSKS